MSIFSSIENAAHSFAAWVEKEWKKLYNEAPKLEQVADTVLAYVGPALQTVVTLEAGGPAGAIVGSVIQEAQKDLTAASGLIYDFGATPSIAGILKTVTDNLSLLLSDGHIKNAKSIAAVQRVISEINILYTAISTAIGASKAAPAAA